MAADIESFIGIGKREGTYYIAFEPPLTEAEVAEIGTQGLLDTTTIDLVGEDPDTACSLVGSESEELAILGAVKAARFLSETRGQDGHYIIADLWNVAELVNSEDTPFTPLED